MEIFVNINLAQVVWPSWQTVQDHVNLWTKSGQQFEQSLKETAAQTTDRAINTVTTTLEQAQSSVENSWRTVTEIKNTTSAAIENTITTYIKDLVTQHPTFLKFSQILGWAINHPIISLVILLFLIALAGSIIKGIIRLIETASWSILKVPFKLLQVLIIASFISLTKFVKGNPKSTLIQKNDPISTVMSVDTIIGEDRKTRLLEIYHRLELIHQEQQQLLQEAAKLIGSDSEQEREVNNPITNYELPID
ncbi:hypothetical protein H6G06_16210 [Anabaena sphaerica FACHB-251]|uniref:Uncharacterized protein n=1 Tax=Anabaena sphaerica FACHB-251 TaxID=2692883 RepID=A0A927A236_9NOST|nr:hypothetical protein [Anabaena sphaerica]MBD2294983.1 hypothetical protein [Anabaena sphaerica FACHB-251]